MTNTTMIDVETKPALVDPPTPNGLRRDEPATPAKLPHPDYYPCAGCPRWTGTAVLTVGNTTLMQTTHTVLWKGTVVAITVAEYRVVAVLVLNHGNPLSYRKLYDILKQMPGFIAGPGDQGHNSNMRSCVKRIRRKFLRVDPAFDAIRNLQSYGYAWKEE